VDVHSVSFTEVPGTGQPLDQLHLAAALQGLCSCSPDVSLAQVKGPRWQQVKLKQ